MSWCWLYAVIATSDSREPVALPSSGICLTAQIATIVPSPSVEASSKEIYMKTTPRLVVNGTNFNIKNTELYFDPPLQEGTAISKQVRRHVVNMSCVVLFLKNSDHFFCT